MQDNRGSFKDISGMAIGRWSVIRLYGSVGGSGGAVWWCKCECGKERAVKAASLLSGRSFSCGCFRKDKLRGICEKKTPQLTIKTVYELESPTSQDQLRCSKCGQEKQHDCFRVRPNRPVTGKRRGRCSHCIACEKELAKQPHRRKLANDAANRFREKLKQENPKEAKRRERSSNLKRLYGITEKEYEDIYSFQDGRCAICGEPEAGGRWKKRFHIDHNHENGKIRGLLCHGCNVAIGSLRENVKILESAIRYIKKHNSQSMTITLPIS